MPSCVKRLGPGLCHSWSLVAFLVCEDYRRNFRLFNVAFKVKLGSPLTLPLLCCLPGVNSFNLPCSPLTILCWDSSVMSKVTNYDLKPQKLHTTLTSVPLKLIALCIFHSDRRLTDTSHRRKK